MYNPEFNKTHRNKVEYTINPTPIILVEGYLILHQKRMRDLMSLKIFLDMPIEETLKRRTKFGNEFEVVDYFNEVLLPMYKEFVVPTKQYADTAQKIIKLDDGKIISVLVN